MFKCGLKNLALACVKKFVRFQSSCQYHSQYNVKVILGKIDMLPIYLKNEKVIVPLKENEKSPQVSLQVCF